MTILYAYDQTNLATVNLDFWYGPNFAFDEFNSGAGTFGYADNYHLYTDTSDVLSLYGYGFDRGSEPFVSVGTLQDLSQWAWDGVSEWVERWHWSGWDADMSEFYAAGLTSSVADDLALISRVMSGTDLLYLSNYDDIMRGFGGNDEIYGRDGNDILQGNAGNDRLAGNLGEDALYGGTGWDNLNGGPNADFLRGGWGNDVLRGGEGRDELHGGLGVDTFTFKTGDDKDFILDFDAKGAVHDVLDLSDLASVRGWYDLKNHHMTQLGNDVRIDALNGDLIVLLNVDIRDLDKGDFIFGGDTASLLFG